MKSASFDLSAASAPGNSVMFSFISLGVSIRALVSPRRTIDRGALVKIFRPKFRKG